MSDSTNRERRNALLGLAACLQASSAWPQYSIETKKETNKTVKKTEFPDSPNELWERAKKLIDLNHPAQEVQAIEEAFGFSFVDIDREIEKNDYEQSIKYAYKISTKVMGNVKISALKTVKRIMWNVEWDRRNCEAISQYINLEHAKSQLEALGWQAGIRDNFPSVTNGWRFHPIKNNKKDNSGGVNRFTLIFPTQKSQCIIGFAVHIIGAK
jgi:hypothetical protein